MPNDKTDPMFGQAGKDQKQLITWVLANQPPKGPYPVLASFGTDWASLVANWLTEWERTGSTRWRDRIFTGMRDIAAMPHGFFNAERMGYEPATGRLHNMIYFASCLALNEGASSVDLEHFAQAYGNRMLPGQTFNPFVHDLRNAPKAKQPVQGGARTTRSHSATFNKLVGQHDVFAHA